MAETFRRELEAVPGAGGRRAGRQHRAHRRQRASAAAVVDEIHARLGWMLTTRAER
jgi:hypothetical protein